MTKQYENILVTGGAGNIGTNLCNELRSRGHKVTSIDLYNTERDNYVRCDVRNYRQLEHVFDEYGRFDYVYHLAAEYGRWNGEAFYENLWQTNNVGTKHILTLQEKYRFKFISILFSTFNLNCIFCESSPISLNNRLSNSLILLTLYNCIRKSKFSSDDNFNAFFVLYIFVESMYTEENNSLKSLRVLIDCSILESLSFDSIMRER